MGAALPLAYAMLLWFVSTGAIIWLDARPRWTFKWSLLAGGLIAVVALWGIVRSAGDSSALGAYCGFSGALLVWGWHEMAFLMGIVTGPRRAPCPAEATGWHRFRLAASAMIYHEIALALTLAAVVALTWRLPNQTASLTFALLFVMRLSTKLNIFAGVPHLTVDFLPAHLAYLKSYFRVRPAGWLFGTTLTGAVAVAGGLLAQTFGDVAPGRETGGFLLFTLAALAILEHAFMVLPWRDAALWRWALSTKPAIGPALGPTK